MASFGQFSGNHEKLISFCKHLEIEVDHLHNHTKTISKIQRISHFVKRTSSFTHCKGCNVCNAARVSLTKNLSIMTSSTGPLFTASSRSLFKSLTTFFRSSWVISTWFNFSVDKHARHQLGNM
jgi:Pyruvate/2-oxoacid:ferredoxin oxidoreductase delta subunit